MKEIYSSWKVLYIPDKGSVVLCECLICGSLKLVSKQNLTSLKSKCCGECVSNLKINSKHSLFRTWKNMVSRCTNVKDRCFSTYGGRGIDVCDKWLNSFEDFINDVGERPFKGAQLDRINNELGYFKDNCRWSTPYLNSINKSNSIIWNVYGILYNSSFEASVANNVCKSTIQFWCKGGTLKGVYYKPKHNCSYSLRYP